jgi:hypothetical protein
MEDVLDLYTQPYDPQRPVVCCDEKLVTLHADVRPALAVQPGQPERVDYEYQRIGTANLFVFVEPLAQWRHVTVTDQRTRTDYARQLQWLAEERYPDAQVIRLVEDNLNTHALASLYLVYPPAEARRLAQRFEVHHTPKHGSWLNQVEIEIGIVERECLRRRVPDREVLRERVRALTAARNARHATIDWQFRTNDARTKLQRLYPHLEEVDCNTPV